MGAPHGTPEPALTPTTVDPVAPDPGVLERAGAALRAGALVAFPTETVYGLGAALGAPDAVARVFRTKGRPATDPLIVHVPDVDALDGVVAEVPAVGRTLATAFWPGPLTLILARGALVGDDVTAGGPTVAVRVPAHPVALGLLLAAGVPVAAPSANRFGRVSPTSAVDVMVELAARLDPRRDLILDGGPTPLGIESTVVDLTGRRPRILRPGGVAWEDLVDLLGPVDHEERRVVDEMATSRAPGGLLRHYAPSTPLVLVEGGHRTLERLAVAVRSVGVRVATLDLSDDAGLAAGVLYRTLRAADGGGAEVLLAATLPPAGLGRAVNDRLFRAAHGRVVTDAGPESVDRVSALARR